MKKRKTLKISEAQREFDDQAALIIGKLILAFSRFEFHLGIALANLVSPSNPQDAKGAVDDLNLKDRIARFRTLALPLAKNDAELGGQIEEWYQDADALRLVRNQMVHGRWACAAHLGLVVNVVPGLPGIDTAAETRYSMAELEEQLHRVERLLVRLSQLDRQLFSQV